jgi:Flp pilus assembly protein TadG
MQLKRTVMKRNRGSVAALAFVAVVPLVAGIGAVAVDSMHFNDARGALQRATDAAALAGAQDLGNYIGTKNKTGTTVDPVNEEPVNYALELARMNAVDGAVGLWNNSNRSVKATIRFDATLGGGGVATQPNRCDVTASVFIRSIFAQIFGNFGQTVNSASSAGFLSVNRVSGYAPMLVSWNDPDRDKLPLRTAVTGNTYTVTIKEMGNKISNAVWIDEKTPELIKLENYIAGLPGATRPDLPTYSIGDTVKTSNGEKGSVGQNLTVLEGKDLIFLVTDDNGDGLTAVGRPVHVITRMIGLSNARIDSTPGKDGYSITGELFPVVQGTYDPGAPANPVSFGPVQVRLIQ